MEGRNKNSQNMYFSINTLFPRVYLNTSNTKYTNTERYLPFENHFITINQEGIVDDEAPLLDLPKSIKIPFAILMAISLVIGSHFKLIVYKYVYATNKQNKGWKHRPINVLIITNAIVHHVTHVLLGGWQILVCILESPLGNYVGVDVCWVVLVVGVFGVIHLTVGSFGIAIYRSLYIRRKYWVKYIIGERVLLFLILFLTTAMSGFLSFLYLVENNGHRTGYNMCTGLSAAQTEILIEYDNSRDVDMVTTSHLAKCAATICIAIQLIEFCAYLSFFYLRYKNDNGNIAKIMKQEDVRKRNLKNAGTFLGQFYGFMVEYTFAVSILTIHIFYEHENYQHVRALLCMAKFIDFGLLSAVEVYTSPALKGFMKSKN